MMPRRKTKTQPGYDAPFAVRLRSLLDEAKIPQATLAQHIGVTRQAISAYALGGSLPDIEKFEGIADFFGVSTEYLLGRTGIKKADASKQAAAEYLGLSEPSIDEIHGLQNIYYERMAENGDWLTTEQKLPLSTVFDIWIGTSNLSLLMRNIWQAFHATVNARKTKQDREGNRFGQTDKSAIYNLREQGYIILSAEEQISFFRAAANDTFKRTLDAMIDTLQNIAESERSLHENDSSDGVQ